VRESAHEVEEIPDIGSGVVPHTSRDICDSGKTRRGIGPLQTASRLLDLPSRQRELSFDIVSDWLLAVERLGEDLHLHVKRGAGGLNRLDAWRSCRPS